MKKFNVKITFEENGHPAAVLVFKAKRAETGARYDVTLETSADNLATSLAKYLQEYLTGRLRTIQQRQAAPEARA